MGDRDSFIHTKHEAKVINTRSLIFYLSFILSVKTIEKDWKIFVPTLFLSLLGLGSPWCYVKFPLLHNTKCINLGREGITFCYVRNNRPFWQNKHQLIK